MSPDMIFVSSETTICGKILAAIFVKYQEPKTTSICFFEIASLSEVYS